MTGVRPAAVAGYFYPASSDELSAEVTRCLSDVATAEPATGPATVPKAIIVPHAGYRYSAPIAAAAYATLASSGAAIRRVVLLGPGHRLAVPGLAAPEATVFRTPLGDVPVDRSAIRRIADLPQVDMRDDAHREEHSIEVQLPFLQTILPEFELVPLVVGDAAPQQVAEVLERLWGGPETLIVVSSDLSHYMDYESARAIDAATATAIETLDPDAIDQEQACGRLPIAGLLSVAHRRGMTVERVGLSNSGDTGGPRDRVVGYGAWVFRNAGDEPAARRSDIDIYRAHAKNLLRAAASCIRYALRHGRQPRVDIAEAPRLLAAKAATFVTLRRNNRLRGCIGTVEATRPLLLDVIDNAYRAAFKDPRYPPLQAGELRGISLSISVLTAPSPLQYGDEADLLGKIRRQTDGLILHGSARRGVFLPQVWKELDDPQDFVAGLKQKAGIDGPLRPARDRAFRFSANTIGTVVLDAWRRPADSEGRK